MSSPRTGSKFGVLVEVQFQHPVRHVFVLPQTVNGVLAKQWRSLEHVGQEIEWIDQGLVLLGHRRHSFPPLA
jgi:hypothetical protein